LSSRVSSAAWWNILVSKSTNSTFRSCIRKQYRSLPGHSSFVLFVKC
jgi:hypothetical protein